MRVAPGYRTSMQELRGKVAVVTGGGGGIGRALGERFLAEGMKVVLADIDERLLQATVDELSAGSGNIVGVPTDVSLLESVEALRDATLTRSARCTWCATTPVSRRARMARSGSIT